MIGSVLVMGDEGWIEHRIELSATFVMDIHSDVWGLMRRNVPSITARSDLQG